MGKRRRTYLSPEVYRMLGLRPCTLKYWARKAKVRPVATKVVGGKATNEWLDVDVEAIRKAKETAKVK